MNHRPTMLLILDGFGIRKETHGNAIAAAHTPHLDEIFRKYPFITLEASGEPVGLPSGQIGNSEVGHTNIGAGNVIYQDLPKISRAIGDGSFFQNKALLKAMNNASKDDRHALHIMGLLSDGGVHSHIDHLLALLDMAKQNHVQNVYLHCWLDGRDVPPRSAEKYFKDLEDHMAQLAVGQIGVISGRFYAMDRDKRWERLELAYDALTLGEGASAASPEEALAVSYSEDISDEFVLPVIVNNHPIQDGDSVVFINFRPDRAREITRALVDENFDGFTRKKVLHDLTFVCMTEYDATMPNVSLAYPPEVVDPTLGKVIAQAGLRQLRIAETEKYAHVTFFFNGGKEAPEEGEDRILVPSPKVATYDLQPEMSAPEVTKRVLEAIDSDTYDVIIQNYANPDMVGHTGNFEATVQAIEVLDDLVFQVVNAILAKDGQILLIADHGNADYMLDEADNVVTKHSLSPVPCCHICREPRTFRASRGKLADVTPTLLTLMGIDVPAEMKGNVLV